MQAQTGFHPSMLDLNGLLQRPVPALPMSLRPVLQGPVHDLVGDSKMPGQMEGEVGVKTVALQDVPQGQVVFRESGDISSSPTMHSIQIGVTRHLNIQGEARFLSHSFQPNCKVVIYEGSSHPIDIVAMKDIPKGAAFLFDYTTTEWEMEASFDDCESGQRCAGFRHHSPAERRKRLESRLLPAHIMELWLSEVTAAQ